VRREARKHKRNVSWAILLALASTNKPLNLNMLREITGIPKSTLQGSLSYLVKKGVITRKRRMAVDARGYRYEMWTYQLNKEHPIVTRIKSARRRLTK